MAKLNWNDFQEQVAAMEERQANAGNGPRVGYFSLKNNGDEAIVRIMHDTPEDFDILAVHQTQVDGRYRSVSCLRGPNDPMDMCPFCADGKRVNLRLYIHMIQYVKDDQGNVVAQPKVWERSTNNAKTLVNYMNEYGPLSDMIFKIKRNGAAGSMDTTYDILPGNAKLYPENVYVRDESLFEGYQALGHAVLDKNYEEMMAMLDGTTPAAPAPAAPQAPVARPTYDQVVKAPQASTYTQAPAPAVPAYTAPTAPARTYREPTPVEEMPTARPAYNAPNTNSTAPARPARRSYF